MAKKLCQRVYTPYDCANYVDSQRQPCVHPSAEEFGSARKFLDTKGDNLFFHDGNIGQYLIDGNLIMKQNATSSNPNDAWSYKIFSEKQKSLEDITKKMGLPLK